jgi:tRNA (guanine37-N1)-methyltransferase
VADHLADEELSIGPYVLNGGEAAALVVLEAVARLVPGVIGNPASLKEESHAESQAVEYPQYTKPEDYKGWKVPEVLLSGNHAEIEKWREEQRRKSQ